MPPRTQSRTVVRRWKVYCSQWASCRWTGYRKGATAEDVTGPFGSHRACPRCGHGTAV